MKTKYFINKADKNKRLAKRTAYKIQQYNNFVMDEYVKSVDDGNPNKPTPSLLWAYLF